MAIKFVVPCMTGAEREALSAELRAAGLLSAPTVRPRMAEPASTDVSRRKEATPGIVERVVAALDLSR
jgi:hypothetical protein